MKPDLTPRVKYSHLRQPPGAAVCLQSAERGMDAWAGAAQPPRSTARSPPHPRLDRGRSGSAEPEHIRPQCCMHTMHARRLSHVWRPLLLMPCPPRACPSPNAMRRRSRPPALGSQPTQHGTAHIGAACLRSAVPVFLPAVRQSDRTPCHGRPRVGSRPTPPGSTGHDWPLYTTPKRDPRPGAATSCHSRFG